MASHRARSLWVVAASIGGLLAVPAVPVAAESGTTAEGTVVALGDAADFRVSAPEGTVGLLPTATGQGWWAAGTDGRVVAAGDAPVLGDLSGVEGRHAVVALAGPPRSRGYWLATADGDVTPFGAARFFGRAQRAPGRASVAAMAASPTGGGYWLATSTGEVLAFGDARPLGGIRSPSSPVVGMAATATGRGYWVVLRTGATIPFGDADALGGGPSTTTGITTSPTGRGFWLTQGDGSVVSRGDARPFAVPAIDGGAAAMAVTPTGLGAWVAVGPPTERVTISQPPGGLSGNARQWIRAAASRAGARLAVVHRGNLDLLAVRRAGVVVQQAATGYRFPMAALAPDADGARQLLGAQVADALDRGEVAFGRGSARLRHARIGDEVVVAGWNGNVVTLRVGAIAEDARTGDAELVLSLGQATRLGFRRPAVAVLWGAPRRRLQDAVSGRMPTPLRIVPGWGPDPPDLVLSELEVKELIGEVAYRPGRRGALSLDRRWVAANVAAVRVPVLGQVTCSRAIAPALRGALGEVVAAGLGGTLGRYGGCYLPRRISGADSGRRLSRHSYGIALDLNIRNNSYGGRVSMNHQVVAIFRRWGFAWGGTWVKPDGMHFEWVGEGVSPGPGPVP